MNYFSMFGSVMGNKLKNTFQYLGNNFFMWDIKISNIFLNFSELTRFNPCDLEPDPLLESTPNQVLTPFVCWKVVSFRKVVFLESGFLKVNYFSMFGSVMRNKLKNIFQYLVMSWKMSWKITY